MDYQAALRHKDAELEERANLLLKTKVAIEQLQDELSSSRRQSESQNRVAEQQALQLRDTKQHLRLVEGELESKSRECTDLLSESLGLKRRLQELQDGLSSTRDYHSSELSSLQAKLKYCERSLAAARGEMQGQQQQVVALQGLVAEKDNTIASQADRVAHLEHNCSQLQASLAAQGSELASLQQQKQSLAGALQQQHARAEGEAGQLAGQLAAEVQARQQVEGQLRDMQTLLEREQEHSASESQAWDRRLRALQEDWGSKLERSEAGWAAKYDKLRVESEQGLEASKREWTRKYYLTEGEWFKKLQLANQDWAAKLEGVGREWMQRYDADRAKWEEERGALQCGFEERLRAVEARHSQAVEEVKQHHKKATAAAEAKVAADLCMLERVWVQRLEAAMASGEQDCQGVQRAWEAAAAERDSQAQQDLVEARQAGQAAVAEVQAGWAARLAEEEKRWLEEKHLLERRWSDKLHATEKAATEAQATLRAQIEARLAAVTHHVADLAQREARREAKRSELLHQVAELRAASEDEHRRRGELEGALREASAIFKRELQEKNEQLDMLRREIRHVRTWDPLSLDYGLADAAMAAHLSRPASRLAHCMGRPASAGPAVYGRPLSPIFVGHNTFMGDTGAISPVVLSPVRPSSAAAKAARAAEKEAAKLHAARMSYQQALLEQQEERTAMLRSINDALKEEIPALAAPATARMRGKWKLGVAHKLHDAVHSNLSSPARATSPPHHLRPRSAAAVPACDATPGRVAFDAHCSLMVPQQQPQSYSAALDDFCGATDSREASPAGPVLNISVDATSKAQEGRSSAAQDYKDLKDWHDHLTSRVGRAVSRLQQLSSEGY